MPTWVTDTVGVNFGCIEAIVLVRLDTDMGQTFREVILFVALDEVLPVKDHEHAHAETLNKVDQVSDHIQLETLLNQCIFVCLNIV